jgi:hypothetical protein
MKLRAVLILFIASFSFASARQYGDVYFNIMHLSQQGDHSKIVESKDMILSYPDRQLRNDLVLALAYAQLNLFSFKDFELGLSYLVNPTSHQAATAHHLMGLYYLYQMDNASATVEFRLAIEGLSPNSGAYYQASNNYSKALNGTKANPDKVNVLIDRVIGHSIQTGDSSLLSVALLNKAASYPENKKELIEQSFRIEATANKSTALLMMSSILANKTCVLEMALEANRQTDLNSPLPVRYLEMQMIKLSLAKDAASNNPEKAIGILKGLLRDTLFLPKRLYFRALNELSGAYMAKGRADSSAYYLMVSSQIDIPDDEETYLVQLPDLLNEISESEKSRKLFLAVSIISGMVFLFFLARIFQTRQ